MYSGLVHLDIKSVIELRSLPIQPSRAVVRGQWSGASGQGASGQASGRSVTTCDTSTWEPHHNHPDHNQLFHSIIMRVISFSHIELYIEIFGSIYYEYYQRVSSFGNFKVHTCPKGQSCQPGTSLGAQPQVRTEEVRTYGR